MTTPSGARGSRRAGTAEREAARAPERKLISVLFADIRGATALVDGLDPEDALARIEPVIAAMEAAVSRFEGTVSKSQGDGIVAFFGAPIGTDDHAVQACFAALQMHRDIAKLGDPDVQIRVGINSGEVVLTQRDRDLSSIYDAAGAVVHTAQRLEAAARAGSTLISRSCLALTSARFSVRDAGTASLKGLHEPVETFELIGPTKISRWQARIARGMSRFVGRDAEMATLRTAAADVAAGRSRIIAIEAVPGCGKSRLAHELTQQLRAQSWTVWEADSESTTRHNAWETARKLLLSTVRAESDAATGFDRIVAFLGTVSDEECLALKTLLGIAADERGWGEATPEYRRRLILDCFARAIRAGRAAASSPVAMLIEDEPWLDDESRDALAHLFASVEGSAMLALITRRPSPVAAHDLPNIDVIRLMPLVETDVWTMLGELIGQGDVVEQLKARIVHHAGGIPLFLEEVVRRLVETGMLTGPPGAMRLADPNVELGIPATVQGVIAGRIDILDRDARDLLQIVSVLGDGVKLGDISAISRGTPRRVRNGLTRLERAALLVAGGQGDVYFPHDLIREVAYGAMVRDRRHELHRRSLDYFAARADAAIETLYRHAKGGEDWPRALAYARRAAANAIESSAYRNALAYYEGALEALERLEPTREYREAAIDIRFEARLALGATAQLPRLLAFASEAADRASALGDRRRTLVANVQKASALTYIGTPDEAIAAAELALGEAAAARVPQIEIVARYILGQARYIAGDYRTTVALMASARKEISPELHQMRLGTTGTTLALIHVMAAVAHASMGEFDTAMQALVSAREIAGETGRPYDTVAAVYATGAIAVIRGRFDEAIAAIEPGLATLRKHDIRLFFPMVATQLGQAYIATGNPERGVALLEEGRDVAEELSHIGARVGATAALAVGVSALGRLDQAIELASSAHHTARQQNIRGMAVAAARTLALLQAQSGAPRTAVEELLAEAIDSAKACEALPALAQTQLALAETRLNRGEPDGATVPLRTAIVEFRRMDMQPYLARATELMSRIA